MKKNLTELVFILDRSGSMASLVSDTIGGFNGVLEKQKKAEGEALVTTVLFDDRTQVIHDRLDIQQIAPLTEKEYYVRGCTALLDAVGSAIRHIQKIHKYIREEDCPEKTLFVITTDGMENASCKYSYERVKTLVEDQKKQGWEFIFLGANIDAAKEAARFGIEKDLAVDYLADSEGTMAMYCAVDEAIACFREDDTTLKAANWRKNLDADYKRRK